jgi:hypothetical protein
MKKIKTFVQRKSKKKYPSVSNLEAGQFESRGFSVSVETSPEETPGVPGEFEGKKPSGFNFANLAIFPPEGKQTPGIQPRIQSKEMEQPDSEAIATPKEPLTVNVQPESVIQGQGKDLQDQTGDRHPIRNLDLEPADWLETLKRGPVADLFRTPGELNGHLQQIQREVNRLISEHNRRNLEGQPEEDLLQYTTVLNTLRNALIAHAKMADFDFEKLGITFAPLGSDLYLERTEGLVKVDGKDL